MEARRGLPGACGREVGRDHVMMRTRGGHLDQMRGVRWHSGARLGDLHLVAIAIGPDPSRGEIRGHAKGVIAIGDIATGWIALGGVARGVLAIGGLALGLVSVGGLSMGAVALGGMAVGGLALGGAAVGGVAIGGLAIGYYALGGVAMGQHAVGGLSRDPLAAEWFGRFVPWLRR
jgi:hypothetical protein